MASLLGLLEQFDPAIHEWSVYYNRLLVFFSANEIPEGRQVAVFLTLLGHKAFSTVQDLCMPDLPATRTLAQLKAIMDGHFGPKVNIRAARTAYRGITQREGQSVAEFISGLRHGAINCEFGAQLADNLLDQFIAGLHDKRIQSKLCQTADLNFPRACEQAALMETTELEVKRMASNFAAASRTPVPDASTTVASKLTGSVKPAPRTDFRARQQAPWRPQANYSRAPAPQSSSYSCFRCGLTNHSPDNCFYRERKCNSCGIVGHKALVCRKRCRPNANFPATGKPQGQWNKSVASALASNESVGIGVPENGTPPTLDRLGTNQTKLTPPIRVGVTLGDREVMFDHDTGSPITVISDSTWQQVLGSPRLSNTDVSVQSYSGHPLKLLGCFTCEASCKGRRGTLDIYVASGTRSCLLGRDAIKKLAIEIAIGQLQPVNTESRLAALLAKHEKLFSEELGHVSGVKASIRLDPDARPIFCKSRPVPLAMRPRIEQEIERLLRNKVIRKVEHSDWATPIVPVLKPDQSVRITGDYSVTLNRFLKIEHYPVPLFEDVFSTLRGGQSFSKIDLSDAYHQIELDEEAKALTTINTHLGLYQFERLPFGIGSAPSIFQSVIDTVVKGLEQTSAFFDDMLSTGKSDEAHLGNLDALLTRLGQRGFRLKLKKCKFLQPSLKFIGHVVDKQGVHADADKVLAVEQAKRPESKDTLRSFLGMVTYYAKFIPNASAIMTPLYQLLHKDAAYKWGVEQQQAFNRVKKLLASAPVLAHYDEHLPLGVTADASSFGLGAVLFHTYPDGSERPIWYASRTLNKAECNYGQIEKEALALIFAVRRFNHYLYGRPFKLVTDHKPLLTLLGEYKPTSPTATARIQRWKLFLSNYRYEIEHRPSRLMGAADALSRNPLPTTAATEIENSTEIDKLVETQIAIFPSGCSQLRRLTERDTILSQVILHTRAGWPPQLDRTSPLYAYWLKRDELSVSDGILLWGLRIVVPDKARLAMLQELHLGHQGASKMKGLARGYVWWPNIESDIEDHCRACEVCARCAPDPASNVHHQWDIPDRPWYRLHVDFAGPMYGKMWMIVVDAFSKYPEVVPLAHATAMTTIHALRSIFARFGLPVQLVSDNGTQFTDKTFQDFLRRNGIVHFRVAPHHPASNGEAERFVQTFKRAMSKTSGADEDSLNRALYSFLLAYRRAPHTTTGQSPSDVIFGRPIRTRLDLLRPDLYAKLQAQRPPEPDVNKFQAGDRVWVRNYSGPEKWKAGEIVRPLGSATYEAQVGSQLYHRHEGQLNKRALMHSEPSAEEENEQAERAWEAATGEGPLNRPLIHAPDQVVATWPPLGDWRNAPAHSPPSAHRNGAEAQVARQPHEVDRPPPASQAKEGAPVGAPVRLDASADRGSPIGSPAHSQEAGAREDAPLDMTARSPRRSTRLRKPVKSYYNFDYGGLAPR